MSQFWFLENDFLTEKIEKPANDGDGKTHIYLYRISNENVKYKGEITLSKNKTVSTFRFLMKIGTGNMWMPADLDEAPYWLIENAKKATLLANKRKERRDYLRERIMKEGMNKEVLNSIAAMVIVSVFSIFMLHLF